jgi:dsDNA-specific endonuclease/ATPase MutS2
MAEVKDKSKLPELDMHGARSEEVFDLMDRFLRQQEAKGASCVRIIHGKGTGKIKDKSLEYCRQTGHQPKADKGQSGQINPGSFLLFL